MIKVFISTFSHFLIEKTVCVNTKNGACCVFPFMYIGKTYNKCTSDGIAADKTWCATKVNEAGSSTEWSYCLPQGK